MNMKNSIKNVANNHNTTLMRAISAEFISRKYKTLATIIFMIFAAMILLSFYLTTTSIWWLILVVILIMLFTVAILAGLFVRFAIKKLRPSISTDQISRISQFVDKFERVTEAIGTPWFMIIVLVLRDFLLKKDTPFLQSVIKDSKTLHKDYLLLKSRTIDQSAGSSGTISHTTT